MKAYTQNADSVIKSLDSDTNNGLSDAKVTASAQKYGINTLTRQKSASLFKRIWESATEPMILMLIGAGLIALAVNIYRAVTGGEADFLECVGIFVAISLSVIISVIMEGRSAKAFEALSKMNDNIVVKAIRNGKTIMLSQKDIVVGDILLLMTGDKIPADGRLISSTDLSVDESALTGESIAIDKKADIILNDEKTPLAERVNMIYSGTYITNGTCKMVVTAVGDSTEFGKIAKELSAEHKGNTPLQQKLSRLGKLITIIGVSCAMVVFASQVISFVIDKSITSEKVMEAFVTSIVLIVAAVPEGLPTIVAVSLSINIIKLSKQNALVKKMIASETIGCINIICSDKTGTLTENKMTVRACYDGKMHTDFGKLDKGYLLNNICVNSTADLTDTGGFIGNPTECAMLIMYENSNGKLQNNMSYQEVRSHSRVVQAFPFNSDVKHMTTIAEVEGERVAYTKGSPECIVNMCNLDENKRQEIESCIADSQQKAMRVIAFAHKVLSSDDIDYSTESNHSALESGMVFDGFVAISDPLRKEVYDAVKQCKSAGVGLKILTGDNLLTATAIAQELNLLVGGKKAVEAKDIAELSDEQLTEQLNDIVVIARSTPSIKMRIVKLLKAQGNVVAVTGDGINDAPALKNADVGIAMGISGTEVSKEASDIVLLNDSFATIVKAVEWGRNIYENFKRFISFQLTVNLASVIVVFMSILLGLPAPFTALELLWINIIMDGPPALTLGLEPNYKDLMTRQPTKRNESIISLPMLLRIVLTGIYMSVIFLCQYVFNFLNVTAEQQPTVLFTLFVLFQLFNSFNCRELHSESIFKHLLKNKIMLIVVGCTFLLQILIIQFAGAFFNTVPLSWQMWLILIGIAFSVIVLSEIVKLVIRLILHSKKNKKQSI